MTVPTRLQATPLPVLEQDFPRKSIPKMQGERVKVFSARSFLRHVAMATLSEFAKHQRLGQCLAIDWHQSPETLSESVSDGVEILQDRLLYGTLSKVEREVLESDLHTWMDDLRRAHEMAHELGISELRAACQAATEYHEGQDGQPDYLGEDTQALEAMAKRNEQECALWMLTFREKIFRDTELHLAFMAKTHGRFWKKHRIEPHLPLPQEDDPLPEFCRAVAQLYKKSGGGDGVHIEWSHHVVPSEHPSEQAASVQLTIYVEGPVTMLSHFSHNGFTRINTRKALESALVYYPATGEVETVVKGGSKNHSALLDLFAKHVVGQRLIPRAAENRGLQLSALQGGLDPVHDWSSWGVQAVRLRRARLVPVGHTGVSFCVEASPEPDEMDAIQLARRALQVKTLMEKEYRLETATVMVYMRSGEGRKSSHFSFEVRASGASTVKNLSTRHQAIAGQVLRALKVMDSSEPCQSEKLYEFATT